MNCQKIVSCLFYREGKGPPRGARTGVSALQRSSLFSSALQRSDLFLISAPALRLPSPLRAPTQFCLALQRSESFCQALQRSNVPFRSILSTFHGRNYSKDIRYLEEWSSDRIWQCSKMCNDFNASLLDPT